jgi:hypothetical protein
MTRETFKGKMTRRSVLSGGLGFAAAAMLPCRVFAGLVPVDTSVAGLWNEAKGGDNLYLFPGSRAGTTVVAVTWHEAHREVSRTPMQESIVRIHTGTKTWNFRVGTGVMNSNDWRDNAADVYLGEIVSPTTGRGKIAKAVVISVPTETIAPNGSMAIWAERLSSGSRRRMGTPFLASLTASDDRLAYLYHASSPEKDRQLLMNPLADVIAAKGRSKGLVVDPEVHGRRLANALLPDVMHYDPRLPFGYTFAARNGRHPSESSTEIANTIIDGGPFSGELAPAYPLQLDFPYFRPSTAA